MATQPITPETLSSPNIFSGQESSTFWVGKVAMGNLILRPECYNALLKFRGDIYVGELGYLDETSLDQQGRERDEDDNRSVLFAAAERASGNNGQMKDEDYRIVGSSRLIVKEEVTPPLPIERYFPEIAPQGLEQGKSAEISRYIARHPEKKQQRMLSLSLVRAMVKHCASAKIDNTYAMMERPLVRALSLAGLPMDELSSPKYIDELKGTLHPVVFYPQQILEILDTPTDPRQARLSMFLGDVLTDGENGHYPSTLTEVK